MSFSHFRRPRASWKQIGLCRKGSIAAGVAKGARSAASGAAKGAVHLATLHPIDAAAAVGTGAVKAGKDVTVGSAKGVGKIGKGMGDALKKIF